MLKLPYADNSVSSSERSIYHWQDEFQSNLDELVQLQRSFIGWIRHQQLMRMLRMLMLWDFVNHQRPSISTTNNEPIHSFNYKTYHYGFTPYYMMVVSGG